jgi:hypothetical protein
MRNNRDINKKDGEGSCSCGKPAIRGEAFCKECKLAVIEKNRRLLEDRIGGIKNG